MIRLLVTLTVDELRDPIPAGALARCGLVDRRDRERLGYVAARLLGAA